MPSASSRCAALQDFLARLDTCTAILCCTCRSAMGSARCVHSFTREAAHPGDNPVCPALRRCPAAAQSQSTSKMHPSLKRIWAMRPAQRSQARRGEAASYVVLGSTLKRPSRTACRWATRSDRWSRGAECQGFAAPKTQTDTNQITSPLVTAHHCLRLRRRWRCSQPGSDGRWGVAIVTHVVRFVMCTH